MSKARKSRARDYGILEEMTKVIGPSGFEDKFQEYFSDLMEPYVDTIETDRLGNCYAKINGNENLPKLMFNAHADTVGFMIRYIDDAGFIFTNDLNGDVEIDYRTLPGTDVVLVGRVKGNKPEKIVRGHFNVDKPIHVLSDDELDESIEREDLNIDIGAKSREQAKHYVNVGDYAVMEANCRYGGLNGNNHLTATNLDDRAGIFTMYRLAKRIYNSKSRKKAPVTFVSTVTEESGQESAKVAAKKVAPDLAITFDTTYTVDQIRENNEDTIAKTYGQIGLGKGPALSRGIGVDNDLFMFLEGIVHSKEIDYQVESETFGCTENVQIQVAGAGAQTALISIPVRNAHTRVETLCLNDLESTIKLAWEFYKSVSRGNLC